MKLDVKVKEIQVGDQIVNWTTDGTSSWYYTNDTVRWTIDEIRDGRVMCQGTNIAVYSQVNQIFRIVRNGPSAAVKPARHWNGKCPRCGKGTYTGFVNVEHDGVCQ